MVKRGKLARQILSQEKRDHDLISHFDCSHAKVGGGFFFKRKCYCQSSFD